MSAHTSHKYNTTAAAVSLELSRSGLGTEVGADVIHIDELPRFLHGKVQGGATSRKAMTSQQPPQRIAAIRDSGPIEFRYLLMVGYVAGKIGNLSIALLCSTLCILCVW